MVSTDTSAAAAISAIVVRAKPCSTKRSRAARTTTARVSAAWARRLEESYRRLLTGSDIFATPFM